MKKLPITILLLCVILTAAMSKLNAQTTAPYEKKVFLAIGDTLPYRILFPENFDPSKKYPLLLMLHGSGERGNDNEAQLKNGAEVFLKPDFRKRYPAIVVFPQCAGNDFWVKVAITRDTVANANAFLFTNETEPTPAMRAVVGLLDELIGKPYINKKQVYVGGLSMGGMGTFDILARKPKVFAAAFPICGGGSTQTVKKYAKKVPLWIFHGGKDNIVLPKYSEQMVQAVKLAGGNPKFTIYANDGHNSWDSALAEPELFSWLFSHKK